jgi:hypothetical protein
MLKIVMALAAAGALAAPLGASAQTDMKKAPSKKGAEARPAPEANVNLTGFDRLDRNRDGYVSRDEAKDAPELQTRFSELDTNNDGKLSREEYDVLKNSSSGSTAERK